MKTLPSVTQPLTLSVALKSLYQRSLAKLAGYKAAIPGPTNTTGTRYGTNSNSTLASMQRVGMMFTAEDVAKNSPISAAYMAQRVNYCSSQISYIPDTGDAALDEDLKEYLQGSDGTEGVWSKMGTNCSMQDAFLRSADIELPVRGDSGMAWYRDGYGNLKLMEFSADQLGEPYLYLSPQRMADGSTYFAGRYYDSFGQCIAYKIYERIESWYGNPRVYPAADVIYFQDPASFRGMRGVTKFANALIHMEKGENLFQIGMDAALRQSKTAYAVFNESGQPDELSYTNDIEYDTDGRVVHRERVASGPLVEYFYTGDKVQATSADSPGPELIAGCEFSDQRVALALGLTYSFLVSPEKVGGAPSRLDVNKVTKEFTRIHNLIHRPALNKVKTVTILDAVFRRIFPAIPTILRGRFMLPISPTVDAFYDAKENIQMLRSGLESPQEIAAETNRNWDVVRRAKKTAAIQVAKDTQDGNRELKAEGYEGTLTTNDLMQLTDNPPPPQTDAQGKPALTNKPATASLAAYMGDVSVGDLPDDTRKEIARILGTNGHTDKLRTVKYGMVASELERMADTDNLESAQKHLRYCTNGSCSDEVHANEEKHVLINNGRIVDGHHYLAKALKGKVTKSLHVIDLTPTRFQLAKLSSFSEAQHPRVESGEHGGEFTSGYNSARYPDKQLNAPFYLSPTEEYSKNFGSHTQLVEFASKNPLDITHLDAQSATGLDLKEALDKAGIDTKGIKFREDEEVAQTISIHLSEISSRAKAAGYDSINLDEYVEGGGREKTTIVIDDSIVRKKKK